MNPFQQAASQISTKPKTEWRGQEAQPAEAPAIAPISDTTAREFKIGNETLRITDDSYISRYTTGPGKYDEVFKALKEGQRIACVDKQQTDRVSRALDAFLKKNHKQEFTIRTSRSHPSDGMPGVWFFAKNSKAFLKKSGA